MYELTARRLAILAVINWCEGSPDYDEAFGYAKFNNLGPHPNTQYPFGNTYTTAAGAYQFIYSTWQWIIAEMGIDDYMSPENQDQAAIGLIDIKHHVLNFVDAGDLNNALQELSWEWASIPVITSEYSSRTGTNKYYPAGNGRYGQPIKNIEEITNYYNDSLAYYSSGSQVLNPAQYNEAVKKKSFLILRSRSLFSSWLLQRRFMYLQNKK